MIAENYHELNSVKDGDEIRLFVNVSDKTLYDPADAVGQLCQSYRVVAHKGMKDVLVLVPLSPEPSRIFSTRAPHTFRGYPSLSDGPRALHD